QARRLSEQAPIRLEESDRVLLEADFGFQLLHRGQAILGLVLGLVGERRRGDHCGDQNYVTGAKHGILTSRRNSAAAEASEGRTWRDRAAAPAPRYGPLPSISPTGPADWRQSRRRRARRRLRAWRRSRVWPPAQADDGTRRRRP